MVFQLLYVSRATAAIGPDDLQAIIDASIRHNGPAGVTGMLLHAEGVFVQLLEGDAMVVRDTADRIRVDPRHEGFQVLLERDTEQRACPCWSMGVKALERTPDNQTLFDIRDQYVREGLPAGRDDLCAPLLRRFLKISAGERAFV